MVVEERLNKNIYKLFLIVLKIASVTCAVGYFINTTLFAYMDIDVPLVSGFCGVSLIMWALLYIAAIVFRFCIYYKLFLYYILVEWGIDNYDYYLGIPLNNYNLILLNATIAGIFLFVILRYHLKKGEVLYDRFN